MIVSLCVHMSTPTPRPPLPSPARCRLPGDAVGLAPSLLPRPGAVAITVTTTALAGASGVVWCDACVPGFGCGLARESVGGVGFEVGL